MVNRSYTTEKPIKAMYISDEEDNSLMVDQDTGNIFTVTMPDKILDKNGKEISKEELKNGNIVAISLRYHSQNDTKRLGARVCRSDSWCLSFWFVELLANFEHHFSSLQLSWSIFLRPTMPNSDYK